MNPSAAIATFHISRGDTSVGVPVTPGRPIFIVGGNGTGKSALVHRVVAQLQSTPLVYVPGSRSTSFDQESLNMTPASRRQLDLHMLNWNQTWESRWRNLSGTARNEKAIHDLQTAETQYSVDAVNDVKAHGRDARAIERLQSNSSPVDRINRVMAESGLPPRMLFARGELRAIREEGDYSIAKMSDGERAALILASDVIAANPGTIFVLDEPELHMHRSITLPLLSTLFKERRDCAFIVSTHELSLPAEWTESDTIIVRGCHWVGDQPDRWLFDRLPPDAPIPEELRVDVLGSRKKIVFVEGKTTSLDRPLYSLLFPSATIRGRSTSRDVKQAVAGLRANMDAHHIEAFGIVDNDGLSLVQIEELAAGFVFSLPVSSVESLYYCQDLLRAVAAQRRGLGEDPESLLARAEVRALEALNQSQMEHLAARLCEQRIRNTLISSSPDRDGVIAAGAGTISVSMVSPYPAELSHIQSLHAARKIDPIVERYPVRYSGVLAALAKGLGFEGRDGYERAALARVGAEPDLKESLKAKLGLLAELLA